MVGVRSFCMLIAISYHLGKVKQCRFMKHERLFNPVFIKQPRTTVVLIMR